MTIVRFPNIVPNRMDWEIRSNTARFASPLTGATRTMSRAGARMAATLSYDNLTDADAGRMRAFLASLEGMANRVYVRDYSYSQRGSFPAPELFTNSDFSDGTTGWSSPNAEHTAADGVSRVSALEVTGGGTVPSIFQGSIAVTQYAAYCVRGISHRGNFDFSAVGPFLGSISVNGYGAIGFRQASGVVQDASLSAFPLVINSLSGYTTRDYVLCSFASIARCALVDNGKNLLLQSDEFDTSWSVDNASIDDQSATAPDGTGTADNLVEDGTAGATHRVRQSVTVGASAQSFSFGCYMRAVNRDWSLLQLHEDVGATTASVYFDLSTGAVGVSGTGANWSGVRGYIVDAGDSWYYCVLVARKTNAATTLQARIYVAEADGDATFDGLSQNSIAIWRATLAASGAATRPVQTTTAATSGTSQTGRALYLKGLPASTSGLLLSGDIAQVITPNDTQLVKCTAPLDSDAAGLGYFQFDPPLRESPADGAPVIVRTPLGRFMLDADSVQWSVRPPYLHSLSFTLVEDIVP